jgi:hypothetical protein
VTTKIHWGCISLLAVTLSCSLEPEKPTDQFEISTLSKIERSCGSFPCTIDLSGVTPFSWDTLYAFQSPEQRDEIDRILQTHLSGYVEGSKYFVFVLKGAIIHQESTPAGIEKPLKNEILFGETVPTHLKISLSDRFAVNRSDEGGVTHYVLKRLGESSIR